MEPPELTEQSLREAALHYVGRRETTRAHLRAVLRRRVREHARRHGSAPEEALTWVDAIVASLADTELVDDQRYGTLRARSLNRAGRSRRAIENTLRGKGLSDEDLRAALSRWSAEQPDAEWEALERHARRRGIGPFSREPGDAAARARDWRRLTRAGFDAALVRQLLDREPEPE